MSQIGRKHNQFFQPRAILQDVADIIHCVLSGTWVRTKTRRVPPADISKARKEVLDEFIHTHGSNNHGLTYAKVKITNLFSKAQLDVEALVDTGATFMCITEQMALQLGFDTTEVSQQLVTFADGTQHWKPKVAPIEIAFGNRTYVTEAIVLGNEALIGVLPLEAMDLVVDSTNQRLIPNPEHPNYPVASAK